MFCLHFDFILLSDDSAMQTDFAVVLSPCLRFLFIMFFSLRNHSNSNGRVDGLERHGKLENPDNANRNGKNMSHKDKSMKLISLSAATRISTISTINESI